MLPVSCPPHPAVTAPPPTHIPSPSTLDSSDTTTTVHDVDAAAGLARRRQKARNEKNHQNFLRLLWTVAFAFNAFSCTILFYFLVESFIREGNGKSTADTWECLSLGLSTAFFFGMMFYVFMQIIHAGNLYTLYHEAERGDGLE